MRVLIIVLCVLFASIVIVAGSILYTTLPGEEFLGTSGSSGTFPESLERPQEDFITPEPGEFSLGSVQEGLPVTTPLTENQREHIVTTSWYIGDESAFVVASTSTYQLEYSGIDDSFTIVLLDAFPTQEHRRDAERVIEERLELEEGYACDYAIYVLAPNTPFEIEDDLLLGCP